RGVAGWPAGATILQDLGHSDDEIFEGMEPSKRRLLRRARNQDVEVAGAPSPEDARAFHRLQEQWKERMRLPSEATPQQVDRPGESWREWELPWMWLLVARQNGEVVAGAGSGVRNHGTLQGRAA